MSIFHQKMAAGERNEAELRGYLQAWFDVRCAADLAKAGGASDEFVNGMVMGASNALYMSYQARFGRDSKKDLDEFEAAR